MVYEEFVSIHIQVFYFFGCENHSTEDMIDLVQKICSNCGLPNILTQDNKCADCNTYAEVKLTSGCRITEFDVVVSSKRTKIAQGGVLPNIHQNLLPKKSKKGAKWTVNIEHATLEGFKNSIRAINQTSALENDGAVLNMLNDSGKYSPKNDQALCEMLQLFVSKIISNWSFLKVCQLYGLGKSDDPSLSVFPPFTCECKDLKDEPSQVDRYPTRIHIEFCGSTPKIPRVFGKFLELFSGF
ncbi:hypothetical protein RhiirA1_440372 [Rhizophagus irregularis]|uniref:Histone H2A C-terminal domain-containing protein n=1 Tax=Rhizophagus irregularis TaxID=588596 RepID=A0A2N0RZS6_9GLOM|nr:hypothetical protein RhiirA1_440372 [Rhizophagus irregularis]